MGKIRFLIIGLLLISIMLLVGCMPKPVARVNGKTISEEDFMRGLETGVGLQESFSTGRTTLNMMINRMIIEDEAADKGVTVSSEEIKEIRDRAEESIKSLTGKSFEQYLTENGITIEDVESQWRFEILLKKLVVPQSEIEETFKANPTAFDEPEKASYYVMYLPSKEEAEKARSQILNGETDFVSFMKENKSLPIGSAPGQINMAYKGKNQVAPEVEKVLFGLQPGELSAPVAWNPPEQVVPPRPGESEDMVFWRLFQVISREPTKEATLENSTAKIRDSLFSLKTQQGEVGFYVSTLRGKARVTILDENYSSLQKEYDDLKTEVDKITPKPVSPGLEDYTPPTTEQPVPTPTPPGDNTETPK